MKVRCSNCGKMVPYAGKVCPYCNAEKGDAKKGLETVAYWGLGGGFVAFIGGLAFLAVKGGPPSAAFCMAFFGALVGGVVGSFVVAANKL